MPRSSRVREIHLRPRDPTPDVAGVNDLPIINEDAQMPPNFSEMALYI